MKRTAGEYAVLLGLLDEALDLPQDARGLWIEQLSDEYAGLRPTLRRMLSAESLQESEQALNLFQQVAATGLEAAASALPKSPEAGDQVGPYRLERELGHGGMGSVWLAERVDGAFKRSVALKLPFLTWNGRLTELMIRERDILAGLEHPNIARFYDAGVDALGRPFLAMEFVEGMTIDAFCRHHALSIPQRLELVLEVAKGVGYAHSKLVVHRDLKPGNILITSEGAARLLDFGVAKILEGGSAVGGLTEIFGRAMTPDYASPEQICGRPVGTPTDVYSLTVLTYELLTGSRPYKLNRGSAAELEQAIAEADPLLASTVAEDPADKRRLRGDLDAILNMGMKKDPNQRYATIDAFAEDIKRYLRGEPVLARPDTAGYRFRKFAGRHRIAIAASALVLVTLVVATTVSLIQARRATHEAQTANAMKTFLLQLFTAGDNRALGSKPPSQITALDLLDKGSKDLLGTLNTEPAEKLELLQAMADIYERLDVQDKARELFHAGAELANKHYGANSFEEARFQEMEGNSYALSGKWPEAETLIQKAEQGFDASGDHRSIYYAQLLKIKGQLLRRHGVTGLLAARDSLQKSAAVFARDFPDSDGYVGVLMYLTSTLLALDQIPQAEAAASLAVKQASLLKGQESELATALTMRAGVKDQLGDFVGAAEDYSEASRVYTATQGSDSYMYLQCENNRGHTLQVSGHRDQGLQLLESTTQAIRKVRPDSNTLANSLWRLTQGYLSDGAYDQANAATEEAMKLEAVKLQVALHTRLLLDQASALSGLGRFTEARENVVRASREKAESGPVSPLAHAESQLSLSRIALASGDIADAQAQILEAQVKYDDAETRRARFQRTEVLSQTARVQLARQDIAGALASAHAAGVLADAPDLRTDVFLTAAVQSTQAQVFCASGNTNEGLPLAEQALDLRQSSQRPGSPLIADAQLTLARCLAGAKRMESAKQHLQQAQQILTNASWAGPQFKSALSTTAALLR